MHIIYPRRSSSPFPKGVLGFPWHAAVFGVGAVAPGLGVVLAAPQIPAELFAFAMLARSGPFCTPVVLLTPALVLAELQRLPNASPPPLDADFGVGLPNEAADVEDVYEGVAPVIGVDAVDEGVDKGTEVK